MKGGGRGRERNLMCNGVSAPIWGWQRETVGRGRQCSAWLCRFGLARIVPFFSGSAVNGWDARRACNLMLTVAVVCVCVLAKSKDTASVGRRRRLTLSRAPPGAKRSCIAQVSVSAAHAGRLDVVCRRSSSSSSSSKTLNCGQRQHVPLP